GRLRLCAVVSAVISALVLTTSAAASQSAPVNSSPPLIMGVVDSGGTLSVSAGSWTGTTPITYTYQWERCGNTNLLHDDGTFESDNTANWLSWDGTTQRTTEKA